MSWENILKRSRGSITPSAKRLVDQVIDETPRNVNQILDLMFKELKRKRRGSNKDTVSGRDLIPTRQELKYYLATNYNKVRISRRTGKEVKSKGSNAETHYFR